MLQKASIMILVSCIFSACSHTSSLKSVDSNEETRTSKLTCSTPASNSVTTQLYFGLSRENAPDIPETEWDIFFSSVLVPEFNGGLSLLSGHGAWLNAETNTVGTEASKLVIIVDEQDDDHLESIDKVVENYVTSFDQQSVLINTFVSSPRFCGKKTN